MNITINGQPVYIDSEILSMILPGVFMLVFFLVFFGIIGFIIRSVMNHVGKQFPAGTLKELQSIRRQIPKGMTWQQLIAQWDVKKDRETGKVTIKRKTTAGESGLSPTEFQVTELAQLPRIMRDLLNGLVEQKQSKKTSASSSPIPVRPQTSSNPFVGEAWSTFKRIALGIALLILLYSIGYFLG